MLNSRFGQRSCNLTALPRRTYPTVDMGMVEISTAIMEVSLYSQVDCKRTVVQQTDGAIYIQNIIMTEWYYQMSGTKMCKIILMDNLTIAKGGEISPCRRRTHVCPHS